MLQEYQEFPHCTTYKAKGNIFIFIIGQSATGPSSILEQKHMKFLAAILWREISRWLEQFFI